MTTHEKNAAIQAVERIFGVRRLRLLSRERTNEAAFARFALIHLLHRHGLRMHQVAPLVRRTPGLVSAVLRKDGILDRLLWQDRRFRDRVRNVERLGEAAAGREG